MNLVIAVTVILNRSLGGANIIDKVKCAHKYGYDSNQYLIALLRYVRDHSDTLPFEIDEQTYNYVRDNYQNNIFDGWYVGLVGFCTFGAKFFGGYPRGFKNDGVTPRNITNESIRNLIKQAPNLQGIDFQCCDFRDVSTDISNFVIYCDPPYRDTTKYTTGSFPYEEYYDWCRALAKSNIVLCSEYWMPDDFKCIWAKDIKCTLDKNSRTNRIERLFVLE